MRSMQLCDILKARILDKVHVLHHGVHYLQPCFLHASEIMTLFKSEKHLFASKMSHSHMTHSFCPTVRPSFNMQCSLFKCLYEK